MTGLPQPTESRLVTIRRLAKGVLQLSRPELALAAGMCVAIGELLALGAFPPLRWWAPGWACGFFLSASALIFNDYFDLEVDRVNAPQRPLPSGALSPPAALAAGVGATALGLASAWVLNPATLPFSLFIWAIGFLYNWKLKAAGLWGNLMVSTSVAATFVLGGIGVGHPWSRMVWTFGMIAFCFDLAEEIAGDAMDAEGDRERGAKSIAILRGKRTALRISGMLFGLVILLTLLPFAWGELGLVYLCCIAVTDLSIVVFTIRLLKSQTPAEGRREMRRLYLSASCGFLVFLIGSLLNI